MIKHLMRSTGLTFPEGMNTTEDFAQHLRDSREQTRNSKCIRR